MFCNLFRIFLWSSLNSDTKFKPLLIRDHWPNILRFYRFHRKPIDINYFEGSKRRDLKTTWFHEISLCQNRNLLELTLDWKVLHFYYFFFYCVFFLSDDWGMLADSWVNWLISVLALSNKVANHLVVFNQLCHWIIGGTLL